MSEAATTTGLELEGVRAGYGRTVVLDGISLTLAPAATLAVLGRNGVGKTTLLSSIMGHTTLHSGHIRFQGEELVGTPPYERCRRGIGFVPQEREIFPSLTVEENLQVAEQPGRWTIERVYDFFPSLSERRRNRGNQLSGGEQQMLAIGRALMGNPALLLMDEPLEGLAPVIVDALLDRARPTQARTKSRHAGGRAARAYRIAIRRERGDPRSWGDRLFRAESHADRPAGAACRADRRRRPRALRLIFNTGATPHAIHQLCRRR